MSSKLKRAVEIIAEVILRKKMSQIVIDSAKKGKEGFRIDKNI